MSWPAESAGTGRSFIRRPYNCCAFLLRSSPSFYPVPYVEKNFSTLRPLLINLHTLELRTSLYYFELVGSVPCLANSFRFSEKIAVLAVLLKYRYVSGTKSASAGRGNMFLLTHSLPAPARRFSPKSRNQSIPSLMSDNGWCVTHSHIVELRYS